MKWVLITLLKDIRVKTNSLKFIRCDNSGENKSLQTLCEEEQLNIKFEFTSHKTPQQNGVVERAFATLYGRVRSMLNHAKLRGNLRTLFWSECANTSTKLQNMVPKLRKDKSPNELVNKTKPRYANYLWTFGEIGIMAKHNDITSKLENKVIPIVFLGYSEIHAGDTNRVLSIKTTKILITRDITWMDLMVQDYINKSIEIEKLSSNDIIMDNIEEYSSIQNSNVIQSNNAVPPNHFTKELQSDLLHQINEEESTDGITMRRGKILTPTNLCNLSMDMNPILSTINTKTNQLTSTFKEAWDHPSHELRSKWKYCIRKEIHEMHQKGIWNLIPKSQVSTNKIIIGCKWVFRIKDGGIHRARLVALGYNQIAGSDYIENFAPVINDISLRIIITLTIINDWSEKLIDIVTVFLYGNLNEDIFMSLSPGYQIITNTDINKSTYCCKLNKTIYSLVQAVAEFYKVLKEFLTTNLNFTICKSDPCLLMKKVH